jgi:molybdenum cofactor guanylyltransferase
VARSGKGVHPVIGLWLLTIAGKLETALDQGQCKASTWADSAVAVFFPPAEIGGSPIDPFFNINRPEDLAEADALLGQPAKLKG